LGERLREGLGVDDHGLFFFRRLGLDVFLFYFLGDSVKVWDFVLVFLAFAIEIVVIILVGY
jgi:hypothetical protein